MAFNYRETSIVKGMLERGDLQHEIAAFFGVNGGRVAEVATGKCNYPTAKPAPETELPPKPPYPSPYQITKLVDRLRDLAKEIAVAQESEIKKIAIAGIHDALALVK